MSVTVDHEDTQHLLREEAVNVNLINLLVHISIVDRVK